MEEKILSMLAEIQTDIHGLKQGQGRMEQRLERVEQRLEKVEQGQEKLERRLEKVEQGQEKLEQRLGTLEQRQEKLERGQQEIKDFIVANNVAIGEILTQALEDTQAKVNALEKVTKDNLFDITLMKKQG